MSPTYVDLRCSRRLTVVEAKLLLDCMESAAAPSAAARRLRAKLIEAVMLASHKCVGPKCVVCGRYPEQHACERREKSKEFKRRLADSAALMEKMDQARAWDLRECALRNPPALKLTSRLEMP